MSMKHRLTKKRTSPLTAILVTILVLVGLAAIPFVIFTQRDKLFAPPSPVSAATTASPTTSAADLQSPQPPSVVIMDGNEGALQALFADGKTPDDEARSELFALLPEIDWMKYEWNDDVEVVLSYIYSLNTADPGEMTTLFLCYDQLHSGYQDPYKAIVAQMLSQDPAAATNALAAIDADIQTPLIYAMASGCLQRGEDGADAIDSVNRLRADSEEQYQIMLKLVENYQEIDFNDQGMTLYSADDSLSVMIYVKSRYTGITPVYLALSDEERSELDAKLAAISEEPQEKSKDAFCLGASIHMYYEDSGEMYPTTVWLYSDGSVFQGGEQRVGSEELVTYVAERVKARSGIDHLAFSFDDFKNITKARVSIPVYGEDGSFSQTSEQTVEDAASLATISKLFSTAEVMVGGAGCPFDITLELTTADGRIITLDLASDSCATAFTNEGMFLRYGSSSARDQMKEIFGELSWDHEFEIIEN